MDLNRHLRKMIPPMARSGAPTIRPSEGNSRVTNDLRPNDELISGSGGEATTNSPKKGQTSPEIDVAIDVLPTMHSGECWPEPTGSEGFDLDITLNL